MSVGGEPVWFSHVFGWNDGSRTPRQTHFLPRLLCSLLSSSPSLPSSLWMQSQLDPTIQLFGSLTLVELRFHLFCSSVKICVSWAPSKQPLATLLLLFFPHLQSASVGLLSSLVFRSGSIILQISAVSDLFPVLSMWLCRCLHLFFASQKINYCGSTKSI